MEKVCSGLSGNLANFGRESSSLSFSLCEDRDDCDALDAIEDWGDSVLWMELMDVWEEDCKAAVMGASVADGEGEGEGEGEGDEVKPVLPVLVVEVEAE